MSPSQAAFEWPKPTKFQVTIHDLPSTTKISSQKFVNGSLPAPANLSAAAITQNVIDRTHKVLGYHVWPNPWPQQSSLQKFIRGQRGLQLQLLFQQKDVIEHFFFDSPRSILYLKHQNVSKQPHHIDMLQESRWIVAQSTQPLHTISKMAHTCGEK
jgi:hypothetical protein